MEPRTAGKLDWIALGALILSAATLLAAPVLYLNSTLHQIDVRLTRIETVLGVDEPEIKLGQR